MPVGSVFVFVFLIGSVIATTLKCRTGDPAGQRPSLREANGVSGPLVDGAVPPFSPSQGRGPPPAVLAEPGRTGVAVRRERRPVADVWAHQRPCGPPVDRVEHD